MSASELECEQQTEPPYFEYSASLRLMGLIPDFEELTRTLGIRPTHIHHRGERFTSRSKPYLHDMWMYTAPIEATHPLHEHIDALWRALSPHKAYLLNLKQSLTVDVFLGYRSNSDTAGLEIPYQSLTIFEQLQVPIGLSIIVA